MTNLRLAERDILLDTDAGIGIELNPLVEWNGGIASPDNDNTVQNTWMIGATMNVAGSVLINLGTNLMKLGHLRSLKRKRRVALADALLPRINEEDAADYNNATVYKCCLDSWTWTPAKFRCTFRRALLSKTWVIGFVAFFIGNALNFLSFSYAAQSLLASLGSVQFITNVIFARVVLKESLSSRVLYGTLVLVAGVALVVKYSCHDNPAVQYSLNELIGLFIHRTYLIYLGTLFCLWVLLQCYLRNIANATDGKGRGSKLEAISYAAVSAIVGAQAVTFFKIVSELISIVASVAPNDDVTKRSVYQSPFSYCVLFAAIFASLFWIQRLNEALRLYDVLFIIPVFQVMWVTLSVVGGGIFFHEFEQCFQGWTAFMFVTGLLTIFLGVFLLSPQTTQSPQTEEGEGFGGGAPSVDSTLEPLLSRGDSFLASGGGMTLPTPTLGQAINIRSTISPFSSGSASPSLPIETERQFQRSGSSMNFGLATMPVVDAVEARDQRASSSADVRVLTSSGRVLSAAATPQ